MHFNTSTQACMAWYAFHTRLATKNTVADPGFESRGGGGGGAWNSKTPKLVIATRSRRGPALAPSRGVRGHAPREILKIGMRRYAFFTILGYNFRKIRERFCKVICTYIYNFYKIFEVTGKIRKIKKKDAQHEENHASNGRPSNILLGCLCPYVTSSKSKCMSLWTLTGAAVHSSAPQTSCCGGLT